MSIRDWEKAEESQAFLRTLQMREVLSDAQFTKSDRSVFTEESTESLTEQGPWTGMSFASSIVRPDLYEVQVLTGSERLICKPGSENGKAIKEGVLRPLKGKCGKICVEWELLGKYNKNKNISRVKCCASELLRDFKTRATVRRHQCYNSTGNRVGSYCAQHKA